ncbi:MAG: hypothetical protein JRD69_10215 [Deltaproteobacteria bacterium]|nr:hypothetical protein [Deltaproteobacteria bacterium]
MNKLFRNNLKICVLTVVAAALLSTTGCVETTQSAKLVYQEPDLNSQDGLCDHLRQLPAVKSVEPWENPYGEGITITTKHYQIHTTMFELLVLRQVPGFMESALIAYKKQLPVPIESENLFTIYLFDDRWQWEDFTKKFTGENSPVYLSIKKGAYYLNGACVAYNIGRTRTFSVLGHEGWHQFNSRHFIYRLPSWLDEGIATLFETSKCVNGIFQFTPERNLSRLGPLRNVLLSGKTIGLEKLIALNPGEVVVQANSDAVAAFYAQSYALTRFLREEDYGKNLRRYHNLLIGAAKGTWPLDGTLHKIASDRNIPLTASWNRYVSPKLFAYYIDPHYTLMEDEYMAFCRKLVYNIRPAR